MQKSFSKKHFTLKQMEHQFHIQLRQNHPLALGRAGLPKKNKKGKSTKKKKKKTLN
jgi:hypothetical protein